MKRFLMALAKMRARLMRSCLQKLLTAFALFSMVSCGNGDSAGTAPNPVQDAALGTECSLGSDRGWCWQQPLPVPHHVYEVQFLDSERGWAVGEGGFIIATEDGGRSWSRRSSPVFEDLSSVRFADASHGWAVANQSARMIGTTDGGRTWSLLPPFAPLSSVQQLWVVGGSTLVASGPLPGMSAYQTIISQDGGASWRVASMPRVTHVGASGTLWSMAFEGLWVSRDFGLTASVALPCKACTLSPVALEDDSQLLVVASSQTRYQSSDAGRTWSSSAMNQQPDAAGIGFAAKAFNRGGTGWGLSLRLVTYPGGVGGVAPVTIWRTSDAGTTWSPLALPSWLDPTAAAVSSDGFLDAQTMWLLLDRHAVLTIDGGATWQRLDFPNEAEAPAFVRRSGGALLAGFGRFQDRWYASTDGG